MTLYEVVEMDDEYALVEQRTGHIVDYYNDRKQARYKGKFMSSGGAFNGFTPRFMCKDSISSPIDETALLQPQVHPSQDVDHLFSVKVVRNSHET